MDSKNYINYSVLHNIYKCDKEIVIFVCDLECFIEKEYQAQKAGHIQLRFGGNKEETINLAEIYFAKDLLGNAYYLNQIPDWEKEKACGLAALNTLLLFFQSNPTLFPQMKRWTLHDVAEINGQDVMGKVYPKLGFEVTEELTCMRGYLEERPRFLSSKKDE